MGCKRRESLIKNRPGYAEKEQRLFDIGFRFNDEVYFYQRDIYRVDMDDFHSDRQFDWLIELFSNENYKIELDEIVKLLQREDMNDVNKAGMILSIANKWRSSGQYIGYKLGLEHGMQQ